jgi:hypothetical protein
VNRIELPGLIGSHPLGALAAFGLLRVLSEADTQTRLLFVERDDWVAAIDTTMASAEELARHLDEWIKVRAPKILACFGDEDVRVPPDRFRGVLRSAVLDESPDDELAAFLVGLAADGAEDNSKHLVKPSPFYMASGHQSFLDTLRKIHGHVKRGGLWAEALVGPWAYKTMEWSAGWDPGTERMHALRHQAPTKDKSQCVAGAVWLGFEALPLFPSFSVAGRVQTVGWLERERLDHWRWALPGVPIGIGALGLLLASADVGTRRAPKAARRRDGVAAIYESTRHEFGQGYAVFRPARRVA